jgi:hypothetical protein
MKRNKLTNNSNSKYKWITSELTWGLILLLSVINFGCEKEDANEYYINYVIDSSNVNTGGDLNVTINTEDGDKVSFVIDQNANWEKIIGPVTKGFNAKISISNRTGTEKLNVYSEINVSKNNSPFVFKASDGPQADGTTLVSTVLEYTIDY